MIHVQCIILITLALSGVTEDLLWGGEEGKTQNFPTMGGGWGGMYH